jgi:hypothetical protein
MISRWKFLIGICGATLLTLTFQGCGHYTSPYAIGYGTPSLIGPGDWNGYLNPAAGFVEFQHQWNQGLAIDYIGIASSTSYTTGFDGLTMNSVGPQDSGLGPVNSTSYDVQVSGFAYFWAPFVGTGAVQAMVPPVCPAANIPSNFVVIKPQTGWTNGLNNGTAFGTMTFSVASGGTSIINNYNLDSVASHDSSTDMGTSVIANGSGCNGGRFSDGSNETFVGPNNFLLSSSNGGFYFAVQQGTTPTLAALAGNYAGILYQKGAGTTSPVTMTLNATGSGTATIVSSVSTGTSAGGTNPTISLGSVTLTDANASGFIAGKIHFTVDKPLVCLPQTSAAGTTQTVLACVGEDDSSAFVSLILVSH